MQKRTLRIEIELDPREEMFSIQTLESESGFTTEFGPTPLWSDWEKPMKEAIGNEIISWIEIMSDEEE